MKYSPDDYRSHKPGNVLTVGPRPYRPKIGRGLGKDYNPNYIPAPEPHRHERRAIGAAFRRKYGRAEYEAMRAIRRQVGGRVIALTMLKRFEKDAKNENEKKEKRNNVA